MFGLSKNSDGGQIFLSDTIKVEMDSHLHLFFRVQMPWPARIY